uniref:Uncharacterized protein n=1 Tax=Arundo donax TaxID=35708 RepID=A0A0A9FI87_ARUDO
MRFSFVESTIFCNHVLAETPKSVMRMKILSYSPCYSLCMATKFPLLCNGGSLLLTAIVSLVFRLYLNFSH